MSREVLWINNDNTIQLNNLKIAGTTSPSTGATVTVQITNGASVVAGTTSAITLTGTSGDYSGVLESTNMDVKHGQKLRIVYTVTSATGANSEFVKDAMALQREV